MSLIVLEQASLSFGPRTILSAINLSIGSGERIGVIGPNGSGKSTLLRLFSGQHRVDGGKLLLARHCEIGYLPQDVLEIQRGPLLASVMAIV